MCHAMPGAFIGTDRLCPRRTRLKCSEQAQKSNFKRMETPRRIITHTAWRLAKQYWTSEEKNSAWVLLVAVIVLNLGNVYIGVRINQWNRAFYNALQMFDAMELLRQVGIFGILVMFAVLISVSALYLSQLLQIRWRRWLTKRYLAAWLADRAYYKLQLGNAADNPDQRISEDLNQFTGYVLSLSVGLISSAVSLFSFLAILWGLSGAADIPLGPLGTVHIPGYLVWAALIYAGVGTCLAVTIGRPLAALNSARQRYEADFRFSLVHLREHAESVALYGGEPVDLGLFDERMRNVFANDSSQYASLIHLNESNFDQTISQSPLPILVHFSASWCGPCRMIAPVLDEIAKEQDDVVKIAKVDVDANPSLSSRFEIRRVPTLLFFKGGGVRDQVVGLTSKADLISRLKTLTVPNGDATSIPLPSNTSKARTWSNGNP